MSLTIVQNHPDYALECVMRLLERAKIADEAGDDWVADTVRQGLVKEVQSIPDVGRKSLVLAHLVATWLDKRNIHDAWKVMCLIPDFRREGEAFSLIGKKVEEISDIPTKEKASRMVAVALLVPVAETPLAQVIRAVKHAEIVERQDKDTQLFSTIMDIAEKMAQGIRDQRERSLALAHVAIVYLKRGDTKSAQALISLIPDFCKRGEAFSFIFKEVEQISDRLIREKSSAVIFEMFIEEENRRFKKLEQEHADSHMALLFQYLRSARMEEKRGNALSAVDMRAKACHMALSIKNDEHKSWGLAHVATDYLRRGSFQDVKNVFSLIPDLDKQEKVLSFIVKKAHKISNLNRKTDALVEISRSLNAIVDRCLEKGDKENIDRAARIPRLMPDYPPGIQYAVMTAVVKRYVSNGMLDDAIKFVEETRSPNGIKARLLLHLLKEYLVVENRERVDKALMIACSSPYYEMRAETVVYVLQKYARIGMADYALRLIPDLFMSEANRKGAREAVEKERV